MPKETNAKEEETVPIVENAMTSAPDAESAAASVIAGTTTAKRKSQRRRRKRRKRRRKRKRNARRPRSHQNRQNHPNLIRSVDARSLERERRSTSINGTSTILRSLRTTTAALKKKKPLKPRAKAVKHVSAAAALNHLTAAVNQAIQAQVIPPERSNQDTTAHIMLDAEEDINARRRATSPQKAASQANLVSHQNQVKAQVQVQAVTIATRRRDHTITSTGTERISLIPMERRSHLRKTPLKRNLKTSPASIHLIRTKTSQHHADNTGEAATDADQVILEEDAEEARDAESQEL